MSKGTFRAIPETDAQQCVWMACAAPYKLGNQYLRLKSETPLVRRELLALAKVIGEFQPVRMLISPDDPEIDLQWKASGATLEFVPCSIDDHWIRDTGPVFVRDERGIVHAVVCNFNGWGNKQVHEHDRLVAPRLAGIAGIPTVQTWLVMEGGGIEFDGAGTAIVTDCSIDNANRNPGRSRRDIESELHRVFGVECVIWIEGEKAKSHRDITDGHVDGYARFVRPGLVIVHLDPDASSREGKITRKILLTLSKSVDARGHHLQTIVIEGPRYLPGCALDRRSQDFAATYLNYVVVNGGVIAPSFAEDRADRAAEAVLAQCFPDRRIRMVSIEAIAAGGGGIHCSTLTEPSRT